MKNATGACGIHEQLKRIAREERARLKSIQLGDSEASGEFVWQCSFKREPLKIAWRRNDCVFQIEIKCFEAAPSFLFCLGRRDRYGAFSRPFKVTRKGRWLRVYVNEEHHLGVLREWFGEPGNIEALRDLKLGRGEFLKVFTTQLKAYVRPRGHTGNRDLLDRLLALIQRFPPAPAMKPGMLRTPEGVRFEPKRLPSYMRRHATLIAEWSIGDDVDRSEKIDAAPTQALQRFWNAVSPHLEKIEAYVESADTGETYALMPIPVAAREAEGTLALRKRGSRK